MNDKLKPCPFCGGYIRFLTVMESIGENFVEVGCCQCGMNFRYTQYFAYSRNARIATTESFTDTWNKRVGDTE